MSLSPHFNSFWTTASSQKVLQRSQTDVVQYWAYEIKIKFIFSSVPVFRSRRLSKSNTWTWLLCLWSHSTAESGYGYGAVKTKISWVLVLVLARKHRGILFVHQFLTRSFLGSPRTEKRNCPCLMIWLKAENLIIGLYKMECETF